ncbi:MAG: hypothetical protein L0Z62_19770 [Gemmataceae bacterium]|nr:hypothetical protein [Gemmataceae bacterium]
MTEIRFRCPGCNKSLRTTDLSIVGKKIKCPRCGGACRVPAPVEAAPAEEIMEVVALAPSAAPAPKAGKGDRPRPAPAPGKKKKGALDPVGMAVSAVVGIYLGLAATTAVGTFDGKKPGPLPGKGIVDLGPKDNGDPFEPIKKPKEPPIPGVWPLKPLTPDELIRQATARDKARLARFGQEQKQIADWRNPGGSGGGDELSVLSLRGAGFAPYANDLVYSPAGDAVALVIPFKNVEVWDLLTRKQRWEKTFKEDSPTGVAFSPDGALLASAYRSGDIKLWDARTGQLKSTLPNPKTTAFAVAFAPDGKTLTSVAINFAGKIQVRLWDVAAGREKVPLPDRFGLIENAALSPDARLLAGRRPKGELTLWDLGSGQEVWSAPLPHDVHSMGFSADGRLLAIVPLSFGKGGPFQVWDLPARKLLLELPAQKNQRIHSAFTPTGQLLAVWHGSGDLELWDLEKRQVKRRLEKSFANCGAFSPGGALLAVNRGGESAVSLIPVADLFDTSRQQALAALRKVGNLYQDGRLLRFAAHDRTTDNDLALLAAVPQLGRLDLGSANKLTDKALAHLKHVPKLKELNLAFSNFSDAGLAQLKGLTELEWLDLSGMRMLTDSGLAHLKRLTSLKTLDLSNADSVTDSGLARLKGLTKLEVLKLNRRVTSAGLAHLKGLTNLTVLELPGADVTDEGMMHLAGMTKLAELNVMNSQISDAGLAHLKGRVGMKRLLLGHNGRITGPGLAHLKGMTGLTLLILDGTQLTDEALAHLKGLTKLEVLSLGSPKLTDSGLEHVGSLTGLKNLQMGVLPNVKGHGLKHLKPLKQVRELRLGATGLTDEGMEGLKELTQLEALALPDQVTDAGFVHLAKLVSLREIYLGQLKGLTGRGLQHLAKLGRLTNLRLTDTGVNDAGLEHLKGATHLKWLFLPPAITDAGLAHLKGLSGLESLGLSRTQVTDAGLDHLKGLAQLRHLYVEGTRITANGIAALTKALPKLNVAK